MTELLLSAEAMPTCAVTAITASSEYDIDHSAAGIPTVQVTAAVAVHGLSGAAVVGSTVYYANVQSRQVIARNVATGELL